MMVALRAREASQPRLEQTLLLRYGGFPKIEGTFLGGPQKEDYGILGSPYFGELPYLNAAQMTCLQLGGVFGGWISVYPFMRSSSQREAIISCYMEEYGIPDSVCTQPLEGAAENTAQEAGNTYRKKN